MNTGYTVKQSAELLCAVRWVLGRLATITRLWSVKSISSHVASCVAVDEASDEVVDEACVWLHTVSGCLDTHKKMFDSLQPDSEALSAYSECSTGCSACESARSETSSECSSSSECSVCESDRVNALNALSATDLGAVQQLILVLRVFIPHMLGLCQRVEQNCAPHCDAYLARAARMMRLELEFDRYRGEKLFSQIITMEAEASPAEASKASGESVVTSGEPSVSDMSSEPAATSDEPSVSAAISDEDYYQMHADAIDEKSGGAATWIAENGLVAAELLVPYYS